MKITHKTAMSGSAQSHLYDERGHDFSPTQARPSASCSSVPEPGPTSVTLSTVVPRAAEARPSPGCITPSFTWCGRAGEAGGINISRGLCLVLALPYLKHLYCEPITRLIPYEHHSGSHFPDRVSGRLLRRPDPSSLSTRPPRCCPGLLLSHVNRVQLCVTP